MAISSTLVGLCLLSLVAGTYVDAVFRMLYAYRMDGIYRIAATAAERERLGYALGMAAK